MSWIVRNNKTGRKSKAIVRRIKRWQHLRLQPDWMLKRKFLIQLLNGAWMAHNRRQRCEVAKVWLAAEASYRSIYIHRYLDRVRKLCTGILPVVQALGFSLTFCEDDTGYRLYRSKTSSTSERVALIWVEITQLRSGNALAAKRMLFVETRLLPEGQRRKPWKKKKRKKSSNRKGQH